ncbi:hypothetical protein ACQU0X_30990 [Pseudovibrio ascidiaceicola]|uniref:hypothetical protein n=1 Tax=Pseudovibrio ascidiaceicola TaxID=285279 RepID=UPI003D35B52E
MTTTIHYITSDTDAGLNTSFYNTKKELDQAMIANLSSFLPGVEKEIGCELYPTWEAYLSRWEPEDLSNALEGIRYNWGTYEVNSNQSKPTFEIRPVIEMEETCESFPNEASYLEALNDLTENPDFPAFKTFWSVYLSDDDGFWQAIADRQDKCSANELAQKLASLRTEPSRNIAVTAACVWEAILENVCDNNDLWVSWRDSLGIGALRDEVYNLAVWVDQVYEACLKLDIDTSQEKPFDWEFVPAALGFIKPKSESEYPGPDDYPIPEEIAPQVIAKLK